MARLMEDAEAIQWDYTSETSLQHMSFILSNFCHYSEQDMQQYRQEALMRDGKEQLRIDQIVKDRFEIFRSGSSMEGLRLPLLLRKNDEGSYTSASLADTDRMIINNKWHVGERDGPGGPKIGYHLETVSVHPGYALLLVAQDIKLYVESTWWVLQHMKLFLEENQDVTIQGPALTTLDVSSIQGIQFDVDNDFVLAVFMPQWPMVAHEWGIRNRPSGWPTKTAVCEIMNKGCHLVPKGHASSEKVSSEWRFSFSLAEGRLSKELSITQKKCYILFKTLHSIGLKAPKGIVSYHLKMILYWAAEEIPQMHWTEQSMGQMLIYLFDKLLSCLIHHNLPSYFIPSNNLIDAVPSDVIKMIKDKVLLIRHNPLTHLLQFNKRNKFFGGLLQFDLDEVFQPVLDHGQIGKTASCILRMCIFDVFIPAALGFAFRHFHEIKCLLEKPTDKIKMQSLVTKQLDSVIDIIVYINRLSDTIGCSGSHPAEDLECYFNHIPDDNVVLVVSERLMQRFPQASNSGSLQARIASLTLQERSQ